MRRQWTLFLGLLMGAFRRMRRDFSRRYSESGRRRDERYMDGSDGSGDSTVTVSSASMTTDVTTDEPKLVLVGPTGIEFKTLTVNTDLLTEVYQSYILGDRFGRTLTLNLTASPRSVANVGIDEPSSTIIVDLSSGTVVIDLNATNPEGLTSTAKLTVIVGDNNSSGSSSSGDTSSGDTSSGDTSSGDTSSGTRHQATPLPETPLPETLHQVTRLLGIVLPVEMIMSRTITLFWTLEALRLKRTG